MPADRLRRLRGPERPAAALPALSLLPPCCGPPEAILRGLRGCAPAAAPLLLRPLRAPCRPAVGHAAPCGPVALAAPCGPCCALPGLPP